MCLSFGITTSQSTIQRIHILQALVNADSPSIHGRNEEGFTSLHSACSAGLSWEILHWLIETEGQLEFQSKRNHGNRDIGTERNVTMRTRVLGRALPLHLIAACPVFEDSSFHHHDDSGSDRILSTTHIHCPRLPLSLYHQLQCAVTPKLLSAFASTTIIQQAYPQAIWEKDCEGEIPLHAAGE